MSKSTLYLIRHGESKMNTNPHLVGGRSNDTPLTKHGADQAHLLGRYFFEHNILPTRVFSSPAVRTYDTARHTLRAMRSNLEITIASEIQELDQGGYVGKARTEVYTPEVLAKIDAQGKDFKLPGGESMNEVGARMWKWVSATTSTDVELDEADRTFVFSHGVAIKTLISTLYNWSHVKTYETVLDNTSFTTLINEDGSWRLEEVGAVPHMVAKNRD